MSLLEVWLAEGCDVQLWGSPALLALQACICVCQGSTKGWAELEALGVMSRSKCNGTAPCRG